jgi:anti-sigma B factor antagonist
MTEQLIVGTTRAGDEAIVSLEGELDVATIEALRAALVAAAASSAANVVVDMARLSFMDAIGLGVLITAHWRCAATGRRLALRHPTGIVEKVLDLAGATHHLSVERSQSRAPSRCLAADGHVLPALVKGLPWCDGRAVAADRSSNPVAGVARSPSASGIARRVEELEVAIAAPAKS